MSTMLSFFTCFGIENVWIWEMIRRGEGQVLEFVAALLVRPTGVHLRHSAMTI